MAKSRLYDGDDIAAWTVHRIVRDMLTMFSPICPFFSHHLSTTLYGESAVDIRKFPPPPLATSTSDVERLRGKTSHLVEFNSSTWKAKKDAGLPLNAPITGISIIAELEEFGEALVRMHKLE